MTRSTLRMTIMFVAFFVTTSTSVTVFGQSAASDDSMQELMAKSAVPGAQLGSLVCENAEGKRVLCSGSLEETILGIVTNVPYITINKPTDPKGSKFIFSALVSIDNGQIQEGDYLAVNKGGTMAKCPADRKFEAYAVALQNSNGNGIIKVKVLNR